MIIEVICNVFFSVAYFLLQLLPTFPSFDVLNISLSPIFYVLGFVNNFLSVPLVGNCLIIVLVVCNLRFVWSIFMWLIRKIPFIS